VLSELELSSPESVAAPKVIPCGVALSSAQAAAADGYNPEQMLFKIALMMWAAAFLIGLLASAKGRTWMARLAWGGFCIFLLAMLIKVLRF